MHEWIRERTENEKKELKMAPSAQEIRFACSVLVRETAKVHGIVEIQSLFQQTDKPSDFRIVLASLVDCYSNHITTRISIQTAVLALGGTGLCSYRVRGVGGSCPKHLTVESYKAIYAANSHTYYY